MATACCDVKFKNATHVKKLSEGNLEFALNLYQVFRTCDVRTNLSFSPLCVTAALAMVWIGARCDTARQIWDVLELGLIGEVDDVHRAFGEVLQRIQLNSPIRKMKSSDDRASSVVARNCRTNFSMANRIYVDESYEIVEEFNRLLSSVCSTDVGRANFSGGDIDRCRKDINMWVEEETDGNVRNLVQENCLNSATRIVIVNAVHLGGTWIDANSTSVEKASHVAPFYRRKFEEAVQVMMSEHRGTYSFVVDYDFKCKVLELPYMRSNLSMLVFLPFDVEGLLMFENKLTPELIKFLKKSMTKTKLTVALPHIRFSQSMPMSPVLTRMGIDDLFCAGRADLSGITGTRDLHFFEFVHSVSLDATPADGQSGIGLYSQVIDPTSSTSKKTSTTAFSAGRRSRVREMAFIADHPFLFLIYDRPTKLIAFMGRFTDPTDMSYELTGETKTSQMADIKVNVEHY